MVHGKFKLRKKNFLQVIFPPKSNIPSIKFHSVMDAAFLTVNM